MKHVIVSGGFDPIHIGHIQYLKAAKELGDKLTVILNGNSFLERKKGYYCFDAMERRELLMAIRYVDAVYIFNSDQDDVCYALDLLNKYKTKQEKLIFAKGGDRRPDGVPIPEEEFCKANGIEIVYGVGGTDKPNSSSWVIDRILKARNG